MSKRKANDMSSKGRQRVILHESYS